MRLILAFALVHAAAVVAAVCAGPIAGMALSSWTHEASPGTPLRDESYAAITVLLSAMVSWLIGTVALFIQAFGPLAAHQDVMDAMRFGVAVSAIPGAYGAALRSRYGERLLTDISNRLQGWMP